MGHIGKDFDTFKNEGNRVMDLSGRHILASRQALPSNEGFRAKNPKTNEILEPVFSEGGSSEVAYAADQAATDFDAFRAVSPLQRVEFLESIAAELLTCKTALIERLGFRISKNVVQDGKCPECGAKMYGLGL